MKIRTKLTLLFTAITAGVLLAFASVIYYSAYRNRGREFYAYLKKEGITKANLFLGARVDSLTLQTIYRNNREVMDEAEVAIYDTAHTLLYHDATYIDFVKETPQMMEQVRRQKIVRFEQERWQVVAMLYRFGNRDYIVTAAAYDHYGYKKLYSLRRNIIIGFVLSVLLMYVAGRYFSGRVFRPVKNMTDRVKDITATNLDLRLYTNRNGDELSELAETFNEMLYRLESSFDAQKQFVSNISHELRTPLAAIIAELELSENRERSMLEYRAAIKNALGDSRKLAKLCNSLLDLAKASYDTSEITFREVRLDEILLDAQQQVTRANPGYQVSMAFENASLDEAVGTTGNEYLLLTAFANLMENACKFSADRHCDVSILYGAHNSVITFSDKGIGIAEHDLPHIFEPFYRGTNKTYADGYGMGLPLMHKIIALHKGTVTVTSTPGTGTIFRIEIPKG